MESEKILPGIPWMEYGNPSPVCFIGSMMRLMAFIGDPVEEHALIARMAKTRRLVCRRAVSVTGGYTISIFILPKPCGFFRPRPCLLHSA